MKEKFTKGPWEAVSYGHDKWSIDGLNGAEICAPTSAPNAHLIAAAPDLYEALLPFARFACDEPHVNEPDCNNCIARAALSKARGESEESGE